MKNHEWKSCLVHPLVSVPRSSPPFPALPRLWLEKFSSLLHAIHPLSSHNVNG